MNQSVVVPLLSVFLVLTYGVALSKLIPSRLHFFTNALMSIGCLVLAFVLGISIEDLGISLHYIPTGIIVAVLFSLTILLLALCLASLPGLHKYFLSQSSILKTDTSRIIYETLFRIPLVTALFEEFIFRGFLLAVFLKYQPNIQAILLCSLVFGLWHIFPAINNMNHSHLKRIDSKQDRVKAFVLVNIIATSIAGLVFAWLRMISGTIIASWLLHWTINAGGVVSVLFAKRQSEKNLR